MIRNRNAIAGASCVRVLSDVIAVAELTALRARVSRSSSHLYWEWKPCHGHFYRRRRRASPSPASPKNRLVDDSGMTIRETVAL